MVQFINLAFEDLYCLTNSCHYVTCILSVSEDNVRDDLNWLKYNCQPWVTVLDKWQKTSSYRTNHLQSGTKKLSDFKMYSDPKADSLVCVKY